MQNHSGGFLVLYTITKRVSLQHASEIVNQIRCLHEQAPITLVGTKADQGHNRQVKREDGLAEARRLRCGFHETSASLNFDVVVTFQDLIRQCRKAASQHPQPVPRSKALCGLVSTLCAWMSPLLFLVFWGGDDTHDDDGESDLAYVEPELW